MVISKIERPDSLAALNAQMDVAKCNIIGHCNWPDSYPYSPKVYFYALHDGDKMYLKYSVEEQSVMALTTQDGGAVWTDSCVEFFCSFDNSGYYNLETSAAGVALLAFRKTKPEAVSASSDILRGIVRHSSLGDAPIEERLGNQSWELLLEIPKESFFRHSFSTLSGLCFRANFYKCGDNLSVPHFLSWAPINSETPNFHQPQFFADVEFE